MSKEAMKLARQIIWRYRHETPLGNQPYMIAHEADEAIEKIDQALAKQEQGEPVAWTIDSLEQEIYKNTREFVSLNVMEWLLNRLNTTPQQRKPLTVEQIREHWQVAKVLDITDAEIDFADYVLIAHDVEALHGIKE